MYLNMTEDYFQKYKNLSTTALHQNSSKSCYTTKKIAPCAKAPTIKKPASLADFDKKRPQLSEFVLRWSNG